MAHPCPDPQEDETPFFDPAQVPVERIEVPNPALQGLDADHFEVIGEKSTYRLAQRPASYVILEYVRRTIKRKDSGAISCPAPRPRCWRAHAPMSASSPG